MEKGNVMGLCNFTVNKSSWIFQWLPPHHPPPPKKNNKIKKGF